MHLEAIKLNTPPRLPDIVLSKYTILGDLSKKHHTPHMTTITHWNINISTKLLIFLLVRSCFREVMLDIFF